MWARISVLAGLVIALAAGASVNTPSTLTLAPGACSGIEIDNLSAKFSYQAQFESVSDPSCTDKVRLSKFYVQEACITDRNNQISLDSVKDLTCTKTDANDQSTCKFVFTQGPEDAKIVIGNLTQGQTFDQGSVCANENSGYIFVQSNCTTSTDVSVVFQQSTYKGPICLDLGGHHLSGWAIAVIVVAIFIVLLIAFWMVWCCCCGSCCCC